MAEEMKPCPFCCNSDPFINPVETPYRGGWKIFGYVAGCKSCGVTLNCEETVDEAISDWNFRAQDNLDAEPPVSLNDADARLTAAMSIITDRDARIAELEAALAEEGALMMLATDRAYERGFRDASERE